MKDSIPQGWARAHLGDFFTERKESGIEGLPTMSVTMHDGLVIRNGLDRRMETTLDASSHLLVRRGDIAYNMMRMWQGACGHAAEDCIVSPAYVVLAPKASIDPRYFVAWSKSARGLHLLWAYSHGLTDDRRRLYFDDFCQIPIDLPPIAEQRRIVNALAAWDCAIETAASLAAARRNALDGLIQRFSARFHNSRVEFGELVELSTERALIRPDARSVELENLESGTGRILGFTSGTEITGPRNVFKTGDTLYGKLRPYLRKFAFASSDGLCSTEIWVLRPRPQQCSREILPWLVQTEHFRAAVAVQSGSKMPRADWDIVAAAPVPCPKTLQEQMLFAKPLQVLARSTQRLLEGAETLRTQKRGLMEKLLTGEWRLHPRASEAAA